MPITTRRAATALGLALLLGAASAQAQQGQGAVVPPTVNEAPSTQHQQNVLRPAPDIHGRSGQGAGEQHGNDEASPGGATGVMGGQTGSGMAAGAATGAPGGSTGDVPASEHQKKLLRTIPDNNQQGTSQ